MTKTVMKITIIAVLFRMKLWGLKLYTHLKRIIKVGKKMYYTDNYCTR